MSPRLFVIAIGLLLIQSFTCSGSRDYELANSSRSTQDGAEPHEENEGELEDGEYDCTATNASTGNGPYSLTCDKSSDEIRIIFANGGFRIVSIESSEKQDGESFWIQGSDRQGEQWEIEISP